VSWVVADGVPERVCADALRVRQILINLTGNAVKFTDRGEVALRVALAAADPLMLRFEVRDSGIGMSAACSATCSRRTRSRIPAPRAASAAPALAWRSASSWWNCWAARSACSVGQRHHFPLLDSMQACIARANRPGHRAACAAAPAPARQFRVLIAEDNRTNQMVAAGMLAMNGCVCEFAADGVEAVRAAQRDRFDLILMDCSMPEMDGYEATAHIRLAEQALGRRTPLIAMTANTQIGDAEKCLAAGMDDYLAKPITLVELRHKLEKWLPHADAGGPANSAAARTHRAPAARRRPGTARPGVFDKLREVLGDSLPHAVTPYLEDMPACLDELAQAVRSGDMHTAAHPRPRLKGASGNFGAEALAQLALQAEQLAAAGQPERIAPLLQPLNEQYLAVAAFLRAELSHAAATSLHLSDELPQVLVVDDDRSTRSTLRHTLQRDGFRVEEASDGQQALAMLARFQPDVILMDAMMPVMDGFTACARMQELPNAADIPVLMITALQDNSSVERAFAAGASDYIPKPIHYAVLSQRVRRIIEANRAEKRIRHLAYNDVLTNLPNRTLFFELLAKSIDHARSSGSKRRCCSWTWTASNTSTTTSATPSATACCKPWPSACARPCVPTTPWRAWAATNSPWCSMSSTARLRPPRRRTTSCAPCPRPSRSTATRSSSPPASASPCSRTTAATSPRWSSMPTAPCTAPSAPTPASSSTNRRWSTRSPSTCGWRATCAAPWSSSTSWKSITSRRPA
jgi:CheY-like chemotaxis protein